MSLTSSRARRSVASSALHSKLLSARSAVEYRRYRDSPAAGGKVTSYCASPYKTGTTFVAGLFEPGNKVAHEPIHYTTLRHIDDVAFLAARRHGLSLDLESSGLFAHRLKVLRLSAPDSPVLLVYRPFVEWAESLINYLTELSGRVGVNYVARHVFDDVLSIPIETFAKVTTAEKTRAVEGLFDYWIECYLWGLADDRSMIVRLRDVEQRIQSIATFLCIDAPENRKVWRRSNDNKRQLGVADIVNDFGDMRERIDDLHTAIDLGES